LVPTQLTAPENSKMGRPGFVPGGGGQLYIISRSDCVLVGQF
jgi:hypothetical protein